MSLEQFRRLLYPRTITMEDLRCQEGPVKPSTSDKKPQRHKARADTNEHTKTSEKRPCKHSACVATVTLVKQLRDTLIHSGSPTDYQSAPEQSDSEQEDTTNQTKDSSQDDSSDNSEAEPEIPQANSQIKRRVKFNHRRDSPEDSQESD